MEVTMCACLGAMYGEPYCYCEMKRRGLPLNETARAEEKAKSEASLRKVFRELCYTCKGEGEVRTGSWGKRIKCPSCKNPALVTMYVPEGCKIDPYSSRACERGTRSCIIEHKEQP